MTNPKENNPVHEQTNHCKVLFNMFRDVSRDPTYHSRVDSNSTLLFHVSEERPDEYVSLARRDGPSTLTLRKPNAYIAFTGLACFQNDRGGYDSLTAYAIREKSRGRHVYSHDRILLWIPDRMIAHPGSDRFQDLGEYLESVDGIMRALASQQDNKVAPDMLAGSSILLPRALNTQRVRRQMERSFPALVQKSN